MIIGVKTDSWSEKGRAWRTEPQGTPTPRRWRTARKRTEEENRLGEVR